MTQSHGTTEIKAANKRGYQKTAAAYNKQQAALSTESSR